MGSSVDKIALVVRLERNNSMQNIMEGNEEAIKKRMTTNENDIDNFFAETVVPNVPELYILRVGLNMKEPIVLESWKDFCKFKDQHCSDCYYRHLYCERNDAFMVKTHYFIKKIMDSPIVTNAPDDFKRGKTENVSSNVSTADNTPNIKSKSP